MEKELMSKELNDLDLGVMFMNKKKFVMSEIRLQNYLLFHPNHVPALLNLARVQFQRQKYSDAKRNIKRALELDEELISNFLNKKIPPSLLERIPPFGIFRSDEAFKQMILDSVVIMHMKIHNDHCLQEELLVENENIQKKMNCDLVTH